ncbi:MAG TPA: hypothetical protein DCY13_19120, partial [Verrucomicrobiales bacterium]|nr:hypothetical protein [Verrucomicrobiales bacterium]
GSDVLLALASGVAAALAITSQVPSALIGVMVALALMPPLVVFGLMLATGQFHAALGALLLLATNVICVNLTGVLTFRLLGIFPRNWWEAERARRATRRALTTWLALMTILIAVLILELAPGR